MSFQKNVIGQKWLVFAFDRTTNIPKTGDAANITAKIRKDYTSATATDDVNPDELEDGYYEFTLTQTESNATVIDLFPESATTNIQVIGVPGRSFTTPANGNLLGINGSGHVSRVTVADSITGNVGGVATGGIVAGSFAADAITAAVIATGAITDAKFTVPSAADAIAGPVGMIQRVYRRFLKRAVKGASTITMYADDGTTPIVTQAISEAGGTQTQGAET